eukprot:3662992-Rhodomonas_salina.1
MPGNGNRMRISRSWCAGGGRSLVHVCLVKGGLVHFNRAGRNKTVQLKWRMAENGATLARTVTALLWWCTQWCSDAARATAR